MRELLVAGRRRVSELWMASDAAPASILDEITSLAEAAAVRIHRVPGARVDELARTEVPQGVVARAAPIASASLDDLAADPGAFLLALDGVTDPQNLGAVMRTAESAGATGIVLGRHRSVSITPTVVKAAAGAVEHLPVAFVSGIPSALDRLGRLGVWRVALDGDGDTSVFDLRVADQRIVLVLGAEGRGVSRLARARCDLVATIPMRGRLASLNVSAAAAIACYQVVQRRGSDAGSGPGAATPARD